MNSWKHENWKHLYNGEKNDSFEEKFSQISFWHVITLSQNVKKHSSILNGIQGLKDTGESLDK